MLNSTQWTVLKAGAAAVCLLILFPPFFDIGGLFGGVKFAFVLAPPPQQLDLDIRPAIAFETLILEVTAVVSFTLAAALAYDRYAPPAARSTFRGGVFITALFAAMFLAFSASQPDRGLTALPFLFCLIPVQYPGGYFLFWLRLAALVFVTLVSVLASCRQTSGAAARRQVAVGAIAAFVILSVIIIRTALR